MSDSGSEQASVSLQLGQEYPPPGEDAATDALRKLHLGMQHGQHGEKVRGEHPKQHGGVWARFTVEENIAANLRVGLFKEARGYTAFVRFSNGRNVDDRLPDVHGLAIKVLVPVEGQAPVEQDFILADHEVFFARNVQHILDFLMATVGGTPAAQLATTTHPKLAGFSTKASVGPLALTYWSQTPYRIGDGAAKYLVVPSAAQRAPSIALTDSPDRMREAMIEQLTARKIGAEFDFCVNPQTNAVDMPVEDPTVEWHSPPVKLATLSIYPQRFDSAEQMAFVENLVWSPWHCLPEHRPLGGINRARQKVYWDSEQLRHQTNGVTSVSITGREWL